MEVLHQPHLGGCSRCWYLKQQPQFNHNTDTVTQWWTSILNHLNHTCPLFLLILYWARVLIWFLVFNLSKIKGKPVHFTFTLDGLPRLDVLTLWWRQHRSTSVSGQNLSSLVSVHFGSLSSPLFNFISLGFCFFFSFRFDLTVLTTRTPLSHHAAHTPHHPVCATVLFCHVTCNTTLVHPAHFGCVCVCWLLCCKWSLIKTVVLLQ